MKHVHGHSAEFKTLAALVIFAFGFIGVRMLIGAGNDGGTCRFASAGGAAGDAKSVLQKENGKMDTAIFAAGCFWGVEAKFRQIEGVAETEVGYTGGHTESPTYRKVCAGNTGHAEAVRVQFDPEVVTYEKLVRFFWTMHDPTTRNRQGPDVGSQYRSAIFTHSEKQQRVAERVKKELEEAGSFQRPITTEIAPAGEFTRAEEYHQRYFEKNGGGGCSL